MSLLRTVAFLTFAASSVAFAQPARVTRAQHGDTSLVLTTGNGKWGPVHDAVEIKRINADSKESTFGGAVYATATADGGVVVYDPKSLDGPTIRQFDADGKFVRNLGRRGSGPGEYELASTNPYALIITARADGSVVVREGNRAVMRFGPDGTFREGFMLFRTGSVNNEVVAANDGTYWIRAAHAPTRGDRPTTQPPMIHYDGSGRVLDSLMQGPDWALPGGGVKPLGIWTLNPDGRGMYTRSDKLGVLLIDPKRVIAPIIIEAAVAPVPYSAEERKELEALEDFRQAHMQTGASSPRTVVAKTKPFAYGAFVDVSGRIWLARPGSGVKLKPRVVASYSSGTTAAAFSATYQDQFILVAFQPDGTLLGEVRFPPGVSASPVRNVAWAIIHDADDTPVLVKYRIFNNP